MRLQDSAVLVTGASSGIGAATARAFARAGARVALVSERGLALQDVACAIQAEGGCAAPLVADFSQPEQVTGLVARAEARIGPLDVLVNNAGVGMAASVVTTPPEDLRLLFDINFFALADLCRQALAGMAARERGRIINVSSGAGRLGLPGVSAYSATKGAIHTFTGSLRCEARAYGVRVSEVLPISVKTDFFENARGRKYRPVGVMMSPDIIARKIVACAASSRALPEIVPYRSLRLLFALESLCPGIVDGVLGRNFARDVRDAKRAS